MIKELLAEASQKMDQAVEHTAGEFGTVRTGRANPGLLHRITVDYYGSPTPLQQIAGFSVPEARMLIVQPYDKSSINQIERAIQEADLGLNPSNDGTSQRKVGLRFATSGATPRTTSNRSKVTCPRTTFVAARRNCRC